MSRTVECLICGVPFQAVRRSARYCGERCKKRGQRTPAGRAARERAARVTAHPRPEPHPEPVGPVVRLRGPVEATVKRELSRAGRLATVDGQCSWLLGRRLDHPDVESGAGVAALARQLRASFDAAMGATAPEVDPLDKLRRRHARKRD